MLSSKHTSPDQIIMDLGGCGRFQALMGIIVHLTKSLISFSIMSMVMITATPKWCCDDVIDNAITFQDETNRNMSTLCQEKMCTVNNSKCQSFQFGGSIRTAVSEFQLVCDLDYIPSTVVSLQAFGMLVGSPIAGHISDLFGRKPPYFTGIIIVIIFNFVGFLSTNWIMFAVSRFYIGVGAGFFLSIQHCILSEFTPANWRPWITGFPSWPVQVCALALVGWLIKDWRYIQLFCCILGIPFLLSWFVLPESFRWFVAHDRAANAMNVIKRWAKINQKPVPKLENADLLDDSTTEEPDKKYTFIHLFKSKELTKITLFLAINCLAGIPTKIVALWLQNRFGRRLSNVLCFIPVAISGFVVGVVQTIDAGSKDIITNVFAIIASVGINTAWGPVQTITIEVYPTVIRNIGMGSMNVLARVGAMVGPQLVYLNVYVPGLMFHVCGAIGLLCIFSQLWLPETRKANLSDKF